MSRSTLLPAPSIELGNAALIAVAKTAEKWADRDQLSDGGKYEIRASLAGTINGHAFSLPIESTMTVGHNSSKASSVTPCVTEILALVLGKLNAATRASVVNEVLEMYDTTGTVEAGDANIALVDELLSHMRQAKTVTSRGPVKVAPSVKECLPMVAVA